MKSVAQVVYSHVAGEWTAEVNEIPVLFGSLQVVAELVRRINRAEPPALDQNEIFLVTVYDGSDLYQTIGWYDWTEGERGWRGGAVDDLVAGDVIARETRRPEHVPGREFTTRITTTHRGERMAIDITNSEDLRVRVTGNFEYAPGLQDAIARVVAECCKEGGL